MAIKGVFTFLEWVQRLTKGYVKHTGKQPDNLAKLKINMEAAQKVKDQSKVIKGNFNPNEKWWEARKATPFSSPQTPQEKIDWLVKNVDPSAKQTIPPRETLEAMLKDGREDLIDHFYDLFSKKLGGPPKIKIDKSELKHPDLVEAIMKEESKKPREVIPTKGGITSIKTGKKLDFASAKEFEEDLFSMGQNFIKNEPRFNLQLADDYARGGTKTYVTQGEGKLHSPEQRQRILDKLKQVMKHDNYQAQFGEDLADLDLTDDLFRIDKASGGIARVGYAGGAIVKGGRWFLKSLNDTKEQIKLLDITLSQKKQYLDQIEDQIRRINAGEPIPDEVIQTIRSDPKFKGVWQNKKSSDPDLKADDYAKGGRASYTKGGLAKILGV